MPTGVLSSFSRDALTFDVADTPGDGDPIVLLHGFPETKESWDQIVPLLAAAGHRVLAPDQRGYSPGARPTGRRAYATAVLVGDVLALADAAGLDRFHLVGHDWGGAVTWAFAQAHPERLASMTSLSTPHPRAFAQAMVSSGQLLQSWYMAAFQLPWLPEAALRSRRGLALFRRRLVGSGLPADKAETYLRALADGAATPALNWYRALPFASPGGVGGTITVPVLYVYSTGDIALSRKAADLTGRFVTAPYTYEVLEGVSHWIPEEAPAVTVQLIRDHVAAHPA
jgi:pimeloyl-ACP methyl ester carboxylesterase